MARSWVAAQPKRSLTASNIHSTHPCMCPEACLVEVSDTIPGTHTSAMAYWGWMQANPRPCCPQSACRAILDTSSVQTCFDVVLLLFREFTQLHLETKKKHTLLNPAGLQLDLSWTSAGQLDFSWMAQQSEAFRFFISSSLAGTTIRSVLILRRAK